MYLKDILNEIEYKASRDLSGLEIGRITDDSRSVRAGDIFAAVSGYSQDGSRYIGEAISKGAKAIVSQGDFSAPQGVIKIIVRDTRYAVSAMADNFYHHPSQKLKTVGLTGTNGKTTITYLIESIIKRCGFGAGVIGTINYRLKDKMIPAKNTTPGPLELQSVLAEMVSQNLTYAVMEVSSHSLDQDRVRHVLFDVGIFTNITSDHLDYHKTIENYFKAKARLFYRLKDDGIAILNADDPRLAALKASIKKKVITYGIKGDADIKAEDMRLSMDGSTFAVKMAGAYLRINTKLIGAHNISNVLAALTAGLALGLKIDAIREGIESLDSVPGRLEAIDCGQPFKVFVDYAHTEDALYNILGLLRQLAKGDIITVFGCGGDRDRTKRPLMGSAACKYSDRVIVTSDNPRFEDPAVIINEIESGIKGKFFNYEIIADRHQAITKALEMASRGDIVFIAGKGHENCQAVKGRLIPFDDRKVAKEILKERYAGKGYSKDNQRKAPVGRST